MTQPSLDLRTLPDKTLAYLAHQLELKLATLRTATSAIGVALYQQMQDKLAHVRAEQERRRC
jgi:hypothetical protein